MAGRSEHSNGHVKLDSASDPDQTIYTLWGRKRFPLTVTFGFLLPVIYHPTNLVYPFTLRETGIVTLQVGGITRKNANGYNKEERLSSASTIRYPLLS